MAKNCREYLQKILVIENILDKHKWCYIFDFRISSVHSLSRYKFLFLNNINYFLFQNKSEIQAQMLIEK